MASHTTTARTVAACGLALTPAVLAAAPSTLSGSTAASHIGPVAGPPSAASRTVFRDDRRFTLVGMPDTQNYSEFYPQIYHAQTQWIADNVRSRDIAFVSHYGDVVNHGDRSNEWANARSAMNTLDAVGVPYGVTAGNHDITPGGSAGTPYIRDQYLANFGPQNYQGRSWYGGASPTGMSNYQLFNGGGREFIIFHIECDTAYSELDWAQGILAQNRDKPAIITTHKYLQDAEDYTGGVPIVPSGRYPGVWYGVEGLYRPDGIQSGEFFQNFVRTNQNVFMVNCGHFHEEFRQTSTNLAGLPVHEVLADYQDDPNGGDGWLRLMDFDLARNRINVESYSPTLNQYRSADESRFSLNVNFEDYADQHNSSYFQQGINGYAGTQDTWINQGASNTSYGEGGTVWVDDDTGNGVFSDNRGQGLLRFDNIISTDGANGTIPVGAVITSATLRFGVADDIDTPLFNPSYQVYMANRSWDESSTWNSLSSGMNGPDIGSLLGSFGGDNDPNADYWRILDVTQAIQRWALGEINFGFVLLPEIISGNDDGIELWSSEFATALLRPALEVSWYLPPAVARIPSPAAISVFTLALLVPARRRRAT